MKNDLRENGLIKLQRVNNRIDHPNNGSKDCSDALCGACWTLTTEHVVSAPAPKSVISAMASVNKPRNSKQGTLPMFPMINNFNKRR